MSDKSVGTESAMRLLRDDEPEIELQTPPEAEQMAHGQADEDVDEQDDRSHAAAVAVDARLLEALLLSTHHPLSAGRLAELMGLPTPGPVRAAIKTLNAEYEQS